MSMIQDSENFEQLRRLLAVKRHEQPPPGYFHSFSREVIVRIKAGELGDSETKWWAFDGSWLHWLWAGFERRPVLAGGVGLAFCGFFFAATLISESGDLPNPDLARQIPPNQELVSRAVGLTLDEPKVSAVVPNGTPLDHSIVSSDFPGLVRAPANQGALPSLFAPPGQLQWQVQPVNFRPQGN